MKTIVVFALMFLGISLYSFADVASPAAAPAVVQSLSQALAPAAPVVVAPPPASGGMSLGLIGILAAVVVALNSVLSAVQKLFGSLAKSEPGWLQAVSKVVLEVAKFLGSNPSV
jgi:hypothetical protein